MLAQILHDEEMEGQLDVSDARSKHTTVKVQAIMRAAPKAQISYIRVSRGADDASRKAAAQRSKRRTSASARLCRGRAVRILRRSPREISEDPQAAQMAARCRAGSHCRPAR